MTEKTEKNEFMLLREAVNNAVNQYMDIRKRIDWKDAGKSATILRLAKPFQVGFFTIAVAGECSSGKSTFINSLIGESLLPTGHFQTTSAVTWIVSSDKRYMEVKFADGSKKTFTANLAEELKKIVAVPEEFSSLPINHINDLIKNNNKIATILKEKTNIEKDTGSPQADASLWRKYVASTPKRKIADEVIIYLQLPAEYEGWRIVDTPGIGAIGGIQDATKKLLTAKKEDNRNANMVDAVILLHKGDANIEDESANRFAEDVKKSMGELANGRLFFVLTRSGNPQFLNNKDEILKRAEILFGKRLSIPSSRLTYVDSVINRFISDARKSGRDFSNVAALKSRFTGWSEKDWNALTGAISPFYVNMMMNGLEVTNGTLFKELEKVSNFSTLRDILYEFLNHEKQRAFSDLFEMIKSELELYAKSLSSDITAVSNGAAAIDKEIEKAKEEGKRLNLALVKLQQKATPGAVDKKFNFIDQKLSELSSLSSINEVRTAYLQIINEGVSEEKKFFQTIISDFSAHVAGFKEGSTTFRSIDFDTLEIEAEKAATTEVEDKTKPMRHMIYDGGWCDDPEYETVYPKKNVTDPEKKRREFTAYVITEGRANCYSFKIGLQAKVKEFFALASRNIKEKTDATLKRLEDYKKRLDEKTTIVNELRNKLMIVESQLKELQKYEN